MRRVLTWALLGALAWWGYGHFFGSDAAAVARPEGQDWDSSGEFEDPPLRADERDEGGRDVLGQETADAGVGGLDGSRSEDKIARFVAALRAGDGRSRSNALAVYEKTKSTDERRRLGDAIQDLVEGASSAEAAVDLLGHTNAFLHSELGRETLDRVLQRVHENAPEAALSLSTKVLAAGMNGPIEIGDVEARAAFDGAYRRHRNLVRRVVFDPGNASRARHYDVVGGDSLDRIARSLRKSGMQVSSGTLALVNRIDNPNTLRVGQRLRIPIDPIRCVVHKSSFTLATYVGSDLVRVYWIAHGKEGHETPETTFVIGETISNPDWHHDGRVIAFGDPDNPLGRFFVKFRHTAYSGFGAHGTNEPQSVGTMASLGCLRLLPDDIREFAKFVPQGAEVEIR